MAALLIQVLDIVSTQLGQRNGESPQETGGDERDKRGVTADQLHDDPIIGANRLRLVWIAWIHVQTKYSFVLWPSNLTKSTSDC